MQRILELEVRSRGLGGQATMKEVGTAVCNVLTEILTNNKDRCDEVAVAT